MAFTTMQQVLDALPGQILRFAKQPATVLGGHASSWTVAGTPAAGITPVSGLSGDVPTSSTLGAIPFTNPSVANTLRVGRLQMASGGTAPVTLYIFDRLWHNSGISATAVTSQTINSVALTRPDALGNDVEAWWHVYAVTGAGTPQVTLTYTDQDGNSGNTALSGVLATTMANTRTGMFQLASGDTGVRSIQTWQADATFSAGTIGLVLRRRILELPLLATVDNVLDVIRCGLASIPDNACLEIVLASAGTGTIGVAGEIQVIQG